MKRLLFLFLFCGILANGQTVTDQQWTPQAAQLLSEAQAAESRQDWPAAEQSYLALVKLLPTRAELLVNLGAVYSRQGKTVDAIEAFKRSAQLNPNLFQAHLNLGVNYFKSGRYDDAVKSLRRTLVIEPSQAQARELLALSLIALEKFQEAVIELELLYTSRPNNPAILQGLGQSYMRLKTYDKAVARLTELVNLTPGAAPAHLCSARHSIMHLNPSERLQNSDGQSKSIRVCLRPTMPWDIRC